MKIRKSKERGFADLGWLKSYHSFSFGDYYDPAHMGFRSLRVINEDVVAPGAGFGAHPHRNMEIVTIVLDGALRHQDNTGNEGVITPGMIQRMSAGKGIVHSEMNASTENPVHLLQIWIEPDKMNIEPGYEEFNFSWPKSGTVILASDGGKEGGVSIRQDAMVKLHMITPASSLYLPAEERRGRWIHVVSGEARIETTTVSLKAGDAVGLEQGNDVSIRSNKDITQIVEFSVK